MHRCIRFFQLSKYLSHSLSSITSVAAPFRLSSPPDCSNVFRALRPWSCRTGRSHRVRYLANKPGARASGVIFCQKVAHDKRPLLQCIIVVQDPGVVLLHCKSLLVNVFPWTLHRVHIGLASDCGTHWYPFEVYQPSTFKEHRHHHLHLRFELSQHAAHLT